MLAEEMVSPCTEFKGPGFAVDAACRGRRFSVGSSRDGALILAIVSIWRCSISSEAMQQAHGSTKNGLTHDLDAGLRRSSIESLACERDSRSPGLTSPISTVPSRCRRDRHAFHLSFRSSRLLPHTSQMMPAVELVAHVSDGPIGSAACWLTHRLAVPTSHPGSP